VSKPRELTADIPKKFSVGYWRRWYDDLTLLEDISLKEDEKQMCLRTNPVILKKHLADKIKHRRIVVPPLVPVKGAGGTRSVSDYDRKAIMKFIGVSEKYEKPKVAKRRAVVKLRATDNDEEGGKVRGKETIPEAPTLSHIVEVVEEEDSSSDEDDDDNDDDDDGNEYDAVDIIDVVHTNVDDVADTDFINAGESLGNANGTNDATTDTHDTESYLLDMSTSYISSFATGTATDSWIGVDGIYSEASCMQSMRGSPPAAATTTDVDGASSTLIDNEDYGGDINDDDAYYIDRNEENNHSNCEYVPEDNLNSVLSRPKTTLKNLSSPSLGRLAGFGFGCNRQEHVLYGMCLDRSCCRRALWEQTALTLKDLGRVRGKRSTIHSPSKVAEVATALVDGPRDYISPLHVAVANCDISSIKHLCHVAEKVNDIVKPYDLCQTLLHLTVIKRNLRVAETLIECFRSFIHIDPVDKAGDTPLHISSKNGDYNIVMLLCDSGANPLIKNKANKYPIDLAKSHSIYQILKVEGDKRLLRDELNSIQAKLNGNNNNSSRDSTSSLILSTTPPIAASVAPANVSSVKSTHVFKTDRFKRTVERKKGSSLSLTAKKKLDDPAYNSFVIGYWKEDRERS
jgi:hypothetical protein